MPRGLRKRRGVKMGMIPGSQQQAIAILPTRRANCQNVRSLNNTVVAFTTICAEPVKNDRSIVFGVSLAW